MDFVIFCMRRESIASNFNAKLAKNRLNNCVNALFQTIRANLVPTRDRKDGQAVGRYARSKGWRDSSVPSLRDKKISSAR
jgi:hypothetical protein